MIEAGNKLPKFELKNHKDETVTNQKYADQWLVLFVYPKDDTPG